MRGQDTPAPEVALTPEARAELVTEVVSEVAGLLLESREGLVGGLREWAATLPGRLLADVVQAPASCRIARHELVADRSPDVLTLLSAVDDVLRRCEAAIAIPAAEPTP